MSQLQWRGQSLPDAEVLSPRSLQWNGIPDAWNLQVTRTRRDDFRASCVLWGAPREFTIVEAFGATQQTALDALARTVPAGGVLSRGGEA